MSQNDRNFDELAERFAKKVYGGFKGEIRLAVRWQDLQQQLPRLLKASNGHPLRILDIGGGLGQIAIRLAQLGHEIVFNDISSVMVAQTQAAAKEACVEGQFQWLVGPYQSLQAQDLGQFDLILCHAVLEWLDEPEALIVYLQDFCKPDTGLSLCFYNPASKVYRNLIRGNFNMLNQAKAYQSNKGSLTPNNPCEPDDVKAWLDRHDFNLAHVSGLRVFHDYVFDKRAGHQNPDEVLLMELKYAQLEPYKWMGRYLHFFSFQKP
ncbi:MAG: methyltransferase domain-containing protein [Pseudomonadales bacterium]|nr:methyltransferase domain-containing protein [Pseudomonadales bacterium]